MRGLLLFILFSFVIYIYIFKPHIYIYIFMYLNHMYIFLEKKGKKDWRERRKERRKERETGQKWVAVLPPDVPIYPPI